MANLLAEWLILAGVCVTDVQAMVENHLKDMILRTFDPKRADTIFTEEGEVSVWATRSFLVDIFWQKFNVLDASVVNGNDWSPHVAFANLSIGRRVPGLLDVEFYHQIDIGCWIPKWNYVDINSRTTNWSIFARIENIDYKIPDQSRGQTKMYWRVRGEWNEMWSNRHLYNSFVNLISIWFLQRMVCHGQHTYVYSQVLIQVLSQELKGGFNMKRLSQEITKYALQKWVQF